MTDETIEPSLAESRSGEDEWRQRYFEARDALFQFKYPPDPKLLREIADEIDCGSDCEHGNTEWDTNAHVCSRSERKEGCAGEKASCLRQFADAIDARSAAVEPTGGVTSPDYVMVQKAAAVDAAAREIARSVAQECYGLGDENLEWEIDRTFGSYRDLATIILNAALAAAPPSPRSDEGSGLTPSKLEGFSAALRAQVIEECAKWHEDQAEEWNKIRAIAAAKKNFDETQKASVWALNHVADAEELRALKGQPAVSAIAQERDVGKHTPTPWVSRPGHEDFDVLFGIEGDFADGHDFIAVGGCCTHSLIGKQEAEANAALIVAAVNAFTTSPKAIDEGER